MARPYDMVLHATAVDVGCLLVLGEAALGAGRHKPQHLRDLDSYLDDLMAHSPACLTSGGVDLLLGIVMAARTAAPAEPALGDARVQAAEEWDRDWDEAGEGPGPGDLGGEQVFVGAVEEATGHCRSGAAPAQAPSAVPAEWELQAGAFAGTELPCLLEPSHSAPGGAPPQGPPSEAATRAACPGADVPEVACVVGRMLHYGHRYIPQLGGTQRALFWRDPFAGRAGDVYAEAADWDRPPPVPPVPEPPKPLPLWTEETHLQFPDAFQARVWLLLLLDRAVAPPELLTIVLQYMAPAEGPAVGLGPYGKELVVRLQRLGLRQHVALGVTPREALDAVGVRETDLLRPASAVKYSENERCPQAFYEVTHHPLLACVWPCTCDVRCFVFSAAARCLNARAVLSRWLRHFFGSVPGFGARCTKCESL